LLIAELLLVLHGLLLLIKLWLLLPVALHLLVLSFHSLNFKLQ
jgi:hypothetical protein